MQAASASVLLLTYNQETYVEGALLSLLEQDYDPLEIVVSDDCSKDGTWAVVNKIYENYQGLKSIVLNRNESNLGIVGNYFKAFDLSSGDLIFTAAGDDLSLPNRCSACINVWLQTKPKVDLVAADGYDMLLSGDVVGEKNTDELSQWSFEKWTKKRPFIFGASHMMTRRLLSLRVLSPSLPVEDQNLMARALMMHGAARVAMPLVNHRRGGVSQTKKTFSYEEKKSKLVQSARSSLVESHEILLDAKLLKKSTDGCLDGQVNLALYTIAIFEPSKFSQKLNIFFDFSTVALMRRLRFFQFSAFPKLNEILMNLKYFWKARS